MRKTETKEATATPQGNLYNGDCFEVLPTLPAGSVDCIICDLPYGVTNAKSEAGKWDSVLPLDRLWSEFHRVAKENAAIVLFAQGMFTANLMMSNPKEWRYNLVWSKLQCSGFLNANRMPLRAHEDICVFYRGLPTYNPQMRICSDAERNHSRGYLTQKIKNSCYGERKEFQSRQTNEKFPNSILVFQRTPPSEVVHPTQKPVDLLRYLIRTYTNKGDTVLDATAGSGTTAVAAILEGRRAIAIEREDKYFAIMEQRVQSALSLPIQGELF